MAEPFWKRLISQVELEAQYDALVARGYSAREVALHLARLVEARIHNAADQRITQLEEALRERKRSK